MRHVDSVHDKGVVGEASFVAKRKRRGRENGQLRPYKAPRRTTKKKGKGITGSGDERRRGGQKHLKAHNMIRGSKGVKKKEWEEKWKKKERSPEHAEDRNDKQSGLGKEKNWGGGH